MGIAQFILIFMIVIDGCGFLYRHIMKDIYQREVVIIILAFLLRYSTIVGVLTWGGFWNG